MKRLFVEEQLPQLPQEIWLEIFRQPIFLPYRIMLAASVSRQWERMTYASLLEISNDFPVAQFSRACNTQRLSLTDQIGTISQPLDDWLSEVPPSINTLSIRVNNHIPYDAKLLVPMAPQLRDLRLRNIDCLDPVILTVFSCLTTLHLIGWRPSSPSIISLNHMPSLVDLRLIVSRVERHFPPVCLSGLTNLQSLVYSRYLNDPVAEVDYSFLRGMTQLTALDLTGYCSLSKAVNFEPPPSLRTLILINNLILPTDVLGRVTQLTKLDIRGRAKINDSEAILSMSSLTELHFSRSDWMDEAFIRKSIANWPQLKMINSTVLSR
jgi:hypothetical protein